MQGGQSLLHPGSRNRFGNVFEMPYHKWLVKRMVAGKANDCILGTPGGHHTVKFLIFRTRLNGDIPSVVILEFLAWLQVCGLRIIKDSVDDVRGVRLVYLSWLWLCPVIDGVPAASVIFRMYVWGISC